MSELAVGDCWALGEAFAPVDELRERLESEEVRFLVSTLERTRWTGRPGYPIRTMVAMCFVKDFYKLRCWTWVIRRVQEDDALRGLVGDPPSQWACYRFGRFLEELRST